MRRPTPPMSPPERPLQPLLFGGARIHIETLSQRLQSVLETLERLHRPGLQLRNLRPDSQLLQHRQEFRERRQPQSLLAVHLLPQPGHGRLRWRLEHHGQHQPPGMCLPSCARTAQSPGSRRPRGCSAPRRRALPRPPPSWPGSPTRCRFRTRRRSPAARRTCWAMVRRRKPGCR